MKAIRRIVALAILLATAAACTPGGERTDGAYPPAAASAASGVRKVSEISGLDGPEAVLYDADQDVYFISNILGFGSVKDGMGYIARVSAADLRQIEIFIQSGRDGVVLDAPKGMALQGDTLWVADIYVLRGFDRRTGIPLAAVDLRAYDVMLLNDLTVGPDGSVYATDSGIVMTPQGVVYTGGDKILAVGPDRTVSVVARGPALGHPNGIAWDPAGQRWIVASFGRSQGGVYALRLDDLTQTELLPGRGRFDGIVVLEDGRILATSWNDSSVHVIRNGDGERIIRNLSQPAALGVDTRRNRLAIPLVMYNQVEFWELPGEP